MAYIDDTKAIVDLLTNGWDDDNTDSVTPEISKIFKQPKELNFGSHRDYVLVFASTINTSEIGIGNNTSEDTFVTITIDVRSKNRTIDSVSQDNDSHFNKVIYEVDRILKSNKVNFDSNHNELRSNQQWQDFNDRMRGIFRKVKTVELVDYCRDYS